ncbi:MAG: ABC transporter substrate-binding protein, partial [Tepidiformaceae bacterium]
MSRWIIAAGALALLAMAAAACGDDNTSKTTATTGAGGTTAASGFTDAGYKTAGFKTVTIDSGATVKIGISSALSGDAKGLGVPIADSAEAAGQGVTIKGHAVEFVREDDLCTAEGGPQAADRLIKDNVVAVVGPICSGGTAASLESYDKAGITHISPSATAGNLTTPSRAEGPYVTFFRVPVLNADEAKAQADFAKNKL